MAPRYRHRMARSEIRAGQIRLRRSLRRHRRGRAGRRPRFRRGIPPHPRRRGPLAHGRRSQRAHLSPAHSRRDSKASPPSKKRSPACAPRGSPRPSPWPPFRPILCRCSSRSKPSIPPNTPTTARLTSSPQLPLTQALSGNNVVVADEFLIRLNAHVGGDLRLGGKTFHIAAMIAAGARPPLRRSRHRAPRPHLASGARPDRPHRPRQPRHPAPHHQAARSNAQRRHPPVAAQGLRAGPPRRPGDGLPRRQSRAHRRPGSRHRSALAHLPRCHGARRHWRCHGHARPP